MRFLFVTKQEGAHFPHSILVCLLPGTTLRHFIDLYLFHLQFQVRFQLDDFIQPHCNDATKLLDRIPLIFQQLRLSRLLTFVPFA